MDMSIRLCKVMEVRKVYSLSLDVELIERVDRLNAVRRSRSRLVEELLSGWVEQGDGAAVRRPVTQGASTSRPPAESSRERPLPRKVDRGTGDGTPLPAIAPRRWAS